MRVGQVRHDLETLLNIEEKLVGKIVQLIFSRNLKSQLQNDQLIYRIISFIGYHFITGRVCAASFKSLSYE